MVIFILIIYLIIALIGYISLYCWACHAWKEKKITLYSNFEEWYGDEYESVFIASSLCWPITLICGIIYY